MPRIARAVAVDFPHHVIQRGNNRAKVFFAVQTREKYLNLLKDYSRKYDVSIMAYCLMTNHVHLLVKPRQPESLAKMMQGVSLCYTQHINKRYRKTGRLWESRYYSCVVDEESYLWVVARYIEQNPVRAGILKKEENYPYSSAPAHILGETDDVLSESLFTEEEQKEYLDFLKTTPPGKEMTQIRQSTRSGRPLGDERFIDKIVRLLNLDFTKRTPGRRGN